MEGIKRLKVKSQNQVVSKDEILFKIIRCGVCSSDIKFYTTGSRIKKFPIILGHEISALMMKYDKKKKIFNSTNKYFIFGAEVPCKNCISCKKNLGSNLCDKPYSIGSNLNGGFSNFFIIKKKIFKVIPKIETKKHKDFHCLSESVACVVNGIEKISIKKDHSVLIIGSGYMGLLFTNVCNVFGIKDITVIDTNQERLNIAKKLGAKNTIKINKIINEKRVLNKINKITNNGGFDRVISANSSIECHNFAILSCSKGGKINLFGGLPKLKKKLNLDSNFIHYKELEITGSFSSNQKHLLKAYKLIDKNQIYFDKLGIKKISFDGFQKLISDLKRQKVIKGLFIP